MVKKLLFALCFGLIYFLPAFFTISHYGISWDEPTHFKRGQGYLWYFLTGDNDYHKLLGYDLLRARTDPKYHERSIYQDDRHNAAFYRTIDGAHPPLADILASLSNMIFYQKLGILGDVESYHLFEIFVASIGVAFLFLFVYEGFGFLAALLATIFYATYPYFWAESHFNIKDPLETSWIILTIYFLWKGVQTKAVRFILLSSVFAGFALGTKFNVVFLPFIILPWFLSLFIKQKKELLRFMRTKRFILSIIFYPAVSFLIFYISYPFLWENPAINIGKVLTFYQRSALDPSFANALLPSWPFYAVRWMILTAPTLVLLGLLFCLFYLRKIIFKKNGIVLLVLIWFVVTLVRVSIPGVNIYGGVRQIMEYIPAMAILAGIGFAYVAKRLNKTAVIILISIIMVIQLVPLFQLHPNENVYFNFLTGGLKGAISSGVPAAGNSFGNAYYQGVLWINKNAVYGAKLTLLQGSAINIPKYKLRSDIDLSNDHFSGINRDGEYLMALTYNLEHKENFYGWEYVDKFLESVYEVKADGVSIAKVWKNDLDHTKEKFALKEKTFDGNVTISKKASEIDFEIEGELLLSRIIFSYDPTDNCSLPIASTVHTSLDGRKWIREKDPLGFSQVGKKSGSFKPVWESFSSGIEFNSDEGGNSTKINTTIFYFPGRNAKFVRLVLDNDKSCVLNNPTAEIKALF